jgi:hypothetical protein
MLFYASLLGNVLNKFQFGIVQLTTSKKDDLWTLKLSCLNRNQLRWIIVFGISNIKELMMNQKTSTCGYKGA